MTVSEETEGLEEIEARCGVVGTDCPELVVAVIEIGDRTFLVGPLRQHSVLVMQAWLFDIYRAIEAGDQIWFSGVLPVMWVVEPHEAQLPDGDRDHSACLLPPGRQLLLHPVTAPCQQVYNAVYWKAEAVPNSRIVRTDNPQFNKSCFGLYDLTLGGVTLCGVDALSAGHWLGWLQEVSDTGQVEQWKDGEVLHPLWEFCPHDPYQPGISVGKQGERIELLFLPFSVACSGCGDPMCGARPAGEA